MGNSDPMVTVLRRLLAAGGPECWAANVPWPMHQAVAEFLPDLCPEVEPVLDASVGMRVPGLDQAVHQLALDGAIRLQDEGFVSWWIVTGTDRRNHQRELFRCDPVIARQHHLAARRWAALAATSANTLRKASWSPDGTSRHALPMRRQPIVPAR